MRLASDRREARKRFVDLYAPLVDAFVRKLRGERDAAQVSAAG